MIPEGFKDTEIGMIPIEWDLVQLGRLVRESKVKFRDLDNKEGSIPILSIARHDGLVLQEEKFSKRIAGKDISNYKVVKKEQIVVGFPIDEGVIYALKEFDIGAVSPAYKVWELYSDEVLVDYLDILLKTQRLISVYRSLSATTVRRRRTVKSADFVNIQIPLPPLHEQRAIATVLSTVQEAKERTEAVIEATRELKKSLMKHLFTYGPVPVDEAEDVPLKDTEIGLVPEEWDVVKLGNVCNISTGTTPSTKRTDYYSGATPFIKTSEIANNIIEQAKQHISDQAVQDYNLKLHSPGTVFLAMYGQGKTRGQVSLLKIIAATTQNTAAILPNDGLESTYLWLYLMSQYEFLRGKGVHGHIPHLNLSYVRKLEIPCPSLQVQQQIADILSTVDRKIEAEENRKVALEELFKTLLSNLMTGRIRLEMES